ncbi:MAG: hypothetical protein ACOCQO_02190 [Halanaerobiaceae bacterium]
MNKLLISIFMSFIMLLILSIGLVAAENHETAMAEVIKVVKSVEIDYEENDLVIIKNYRGKYIDTLSKQYIDIDAGYESYTLAIFGSVRDLEYVYGNKGSEGNSQKVASLISDKLISFENAPSLSDNDLFVEVSFKDNNGKEYKLPLTDDQEGYLLIEDTGKLTAEAGHVLKATYPTDGGRFYVEVNNSEEYSPGYFKHYLYLETDGEKNLLAESVDMGSNWIESVDDILNPTLSNDKTKVYYETGTGFNRSNGVAANNHQTRVIDLDTMEDRYFHEGGIVKLLKGEDTPFTDGIILEKYTRNDDGEIVTNNYLVSPEGKTLLNLGEELEEDVASQAITLLERKYDGEVNIKELMSPWTDEIIHGEEITYSSYMLVVIEDYLDNGKNEFEKIIEFTNPFYQDNSNYETTSDSYYNFAVFGTITNVKLLTAPDMESEYRRYDIADKISDSIVKVSTKFPTDFSVDRISFYTEDGQHQEMIFEDMSDNIDIVKIDYPY